MTVDAILFAVLACMLVHFLSKGANSVSQFVVALVVTMVLSLPSGWENTLNGHHAGWFFFYIFSILGLWLVLNQEPFGKQWSIGLVSMIAAYFSLFAGVVTVATAIAIISLKMICSRKATTRSLFGLGILLGVFLAGIGLEPHFPGQANLAVSSVSAFWKALGYALVWPHDNLAVTSFLVHAPFVLLVVFLVLRRPHFSTRIAMAVALGTWTWLQAAGIAYGRGAAGARPVIRYMDILSIGVIANFAALLVLGERIGRRRNGMLLMLAFSMLWMTSIAVGLQKRTSLNYTAWLPGKRATSLAEDTNLRAFVVTGDRRYIDNIPAAEIGYYNGAARLSSLLTDPTLQQILPPSIREPLIITRSQTTGSVFRLAGYPPEFPGVRDPYVFGSYSASGAAAQGVFESDLLPPPRLPALQFRVAGDLGQPGLSLTLVTTSGRVLPVQGAPASRTAWTNIQIWAPREPFRIVARDASAVGWFAFSPPREMGAYSFIAEWLVHHGSWFLWFGYAGFGVLFGWQNLLMLRERQTPDTARL